MRILRSHVVLPFSLLAFFCAGCGIDADGLALGAGGTGGGTGAGARAGAPGEAGGPGRSGAAGTSAGAAGKGGVTAGGKSGAAGSSSAGDGGGAGAAGTPSQGGKGGSTAGVGGGSAAGGDAGSGTAAGTSGAGGGGGAGSAGSSGGTSGDGGTAGGGGASGSGLAGSGGTAGSGTAGSGTAGSGTAGSGTAGSGGASGSGTAGNGGSAGAPPLPICGDGRVNTPAEECDDGNAIEDDACSNACLVRCPAPGTGATDAGLKNPATDRCYFTTNTLQANAPSRDANACVGPGVHIATVSDARDQSWIAQGVAPQGYRAWIGGRLDGAVPFGPKAFVWFEGGPITDTFWAGGEPNPPEDACLTLRETNLAAPGGLDRRYRYASSPCTRQAQSPLPTLCVREPTCRIAGLDGVVGDGGHCYATSPNDVPSFAAAKAFCGDRGGHLATFESPEELRRLGGSGFRNVWVGATQTVAGAATNAGWRWSEGPTPGAAVSDELWNGGEPNDGGPKAADTGIEDCATLLNGTRRLNDAPCAQTINRALCEFE